ncbi:hypothetical protein KFE25_011396 [Diacronema lutheri]|uniref:Peptidyl-prolyl cis-trans isomerase n=1 Tax=Diacronema lutheri TaxID=2081491 RepID=A0A8J5X8B1_DIALT|nr:hypothetical protein KFE25_011396 [Diacronema lutheri]
MAPLRVLALVVGLFGLARASATARVASRPASRLARSAVLASAQGATETARPNQARAAHILVDTEELADAIRAQVEGGMSFGDIAKTVSLCTSRSRGGNLGWFSAGMMTPDFERACFDATPGSLVKVQSEFGWHLIHVEETRAAPTDVSPAELKRRIDANDVHGVQFVDVRSADEVSRASIPGVQWVNLPFNEYSEWGDKVAAGELLEHEKETIVICHHGMRSSRTAQFMLQNGFRSVVSLLGGIDAYAAEADPAVGRYQNEMKGEECSSCG